VNFFNPLQIIIRIRIKEKKIIKERWNDSGKADKAINALQKKYTENRPDKNSLPF